MSNLKQKSASPKQRANATHHVPFRWRQESEDAEFLIDQEYFQAAVKPSPVDWSTLTGECDFDVAQNSIARISEKSDSQFENILLLESLSHQLVNSLANSFAPDSTKILLDLAKRIIFHIDETNPGILEPIASKSLSWPCQVTLKDLIKQRQRKTPSAEFSLRERLETIGLGKNYPTKDLGNNTPNQLALRMIEIIHANKQKIARLNIVRETNPENYEQDYERFPKWVKDCEGLKPLDEPGAAAAWFSVGWKALLEATNHQPESIPDLKEIGKYRKNRITTKDPMPGFLSDDRRPLTKTQRSNIRDGIKTKTKTAFIRLVRESKNQSHTNEL